jgi:hypothetical protein
MGFEQRLLQPVRCWCLKSQDYQNGLEASSDSWITDSFVD